MSLVEQLHAAHKERMARLSPPPRDDEAIKQLQKDINRLNEELRRARFVMDEQKKYIAKLAGVAASTTPKLEEIFSTVCKYYDVSADAMRGNGRTYPLYHYRQVYYYLAREYSHSLTQTGLYIRKDHTSVLHGTRKIEEMLKTDLQLEIDLKEIRQKIGKRVFDRQQALEKLIDLKEVG
ncbi:helix-turn-helix domain-containing protein [Bradyrhizobium sp. SZCCHNRI1073]|uniref:helix-turn-helix domain-containing protein n=1 Tax=Bradyrhizobium sp. SZCCHNRI1073 TaxID=3057280 RepID=UPI00291663C4|nr:helix-turn-helix domain-containing protein [Bradyrhizobium sp. SZCCHNRI1073]